MRALAHQALSLKQPHHCVDLVEGALRTGLGHVDGQTEALLHITHARAYAATDENLSAARALLAAEGALLRDDGPQPSYSRVSGPAAGTVASHTARTLTDLAEPHRHRAAAPRRPHPLGPREVQARPRPHPRRPRRQPCRPGPRRRGRRRLDPGPGPDGGHDLRPDTEGDHVDPLHPRDLPAPPYPWRRRSRPPRPRGPRLTCPTTRPTKGTP